MKKNPRKTQLLPLMFELGRIIRGELARALAPLSLIHFETLRFIAEEHTPTMRDVAEYLKITAPTATDIVNALVRGKCVVRAVDPEDRRKVRLMPTPAGERTLLRGNRAKERAFARVVARLGKRDQAELARLLTIITHTR